MVAWRMIIPPSLYGSNLLKLTSILKQGHILVSGLSLSGLISSNLTLRQKYEDFGSKIIQVGTVHVDFWSGTIESVSKTLGSN